MLFQLQNSIRQPIFRTFLSAVLFLGASAVLAQDPSASRTVDADKQLLFATPDQAVAALVASFQSDDDAVLLDLFGQTHKDLIVVSDRIGRKETFDQLTRAAKEATKLEEEDAETRIVIIGKNDWPFPIPLVKTAAGWKFDTDAGEDEILNRRIGENELDAIANCAAFIAAQLEYASEDHDNDEVLEYAQRIMSTRNAHDGLYWDADPSKGEELSPFGPLLAEASAYLEASGGKPIPYKGYFYRILKAQGANPPGGKYDYVINGNMIAGFALLAYPADYGASGIMTFLVSHQGKIYEKDLGDDTHSAVADLKDYNPDDSWVLAEDDD